MLGKVVLWEDLQLLEVVVGPLLLERDFQEDLAAAQVIFLSINREQHPMQI
jgi:hypothetical protein